ncbi:MAG: DUF2461 domain-containing protein [Pseudomonadota bacterium]
MSDGFSDLIDRANAFFTELAKDNTKAFYEPRKEHYRDEIKKPAELFADLFAEDIARHTGKPHGPKLFRIHRDVRFSKDKTPYNTHLHLIWQQPSQAPTPAWFFGASPDYTTFVTGIPGLQGDALTRFRALIDKRGDALTDAIDHARDALGAEISEWGPSPLKRVPKPYDPDHPHGDLLKRKGLTIGAPLPEGWRDDGLLTTLNGMVPVMLPIWQIFEEAFPAN